MRVQGGARITIAARQSPPTGANRTPQSKTSVLRFLLPTGTPPTGAPESHHKQNDSFAPIRVKGRCPLRVQGRARITIAARQSPPTGVPPKKAAVLAPAAPSTHPCPVRSSPPKPRRHYQSAPNQAPTRCPNRQKRKARTD